MSMIRSSKEQKNETEKLLSKISTFELLNILDEGILVVNKNCEVLFYNKSIEKIEGMKIERIKGKNIFDIFPGLSNKNSTILKTIKEGKPSKNVLQTYQTVYGRKITTLNTTLPFYENGVVVGAIEVVRDISAVKEMSLKLIDLQEEVIFANKELKASRKKNKITFDDIIGENYLIKNTVEIAKKASQTSSPVLITGETGTGKELFAESIHNYSKRFNKPFIAINCAALPEGLLEGILFGTAQGGFTDAVDRPGVFEQANGGTVLLDEINSMDLFLQSKLLRILEEKKVQRVGGVKKINLDLKVLSTSNVDLKEQVSNKRFREDLFYRLNVVNVVVPPLRERKKDLPILITYFLNYYNNLFSKNVLSLSDKLMEEFWEYDWPGNVRELKHCIESGMNLIDKYDNVLKPEHLSSFMKTLKTRSHLSESSKQQEEREKSANSDFSSRAGDTGSIDKSLNNFEKRIIIDAILKTNGNISKAAQALGLKRQTLSYRMKKLNITKGDFTYSYK